MAEIETATITADEARILTDAIKSALVATWNLREQAYMSRVWVPLGYSSWERYCEAEFSTVAIPRAERQSVVAAMRSAGMSTRAIAAATGLGVGTVHRELAGVPSGTPETIVGADGKTYAAARPASTTPNTDELLRMLKPMLRQTGTESPLGKAVPDFMKELNESLMARFNISPADLAPLVEEQRAKPLDAERCKALAAMTGSEFEDLLSELENPPADYPEDDVIRLRLRALAVRMDRRVGELLTMEDK